jgi:ribosome hibernation promoting factor
MDVVIAQGRRIVPDDVRNLTEEKVAKLGHRCPGLERAEVRFAEEHNPRIPDRECCEVVITGHGQTIRAHASGPTVLAAVDRVVAKLEHQLEKTKGRMVGRSQPRHRVTSPAPQLYQRVRTA